MGSRFWGHNKRIWRWNVPSPHVMPEKPSGQTHSNLATKFRQVALFWHGLKEHSSKSKKKKKKLYRVMFLNQPVLFFSISSISTLTDCDSYNFYCFYGDCSSYCFPLHCYLHHSCKLLLYRFSQNLCFCVQFIQFKIKRFFWQFANIWWRENMATLQLFHFSHISKAPLNPLNF